jgi:chemotaxis protein histidine kinase CheA
VQIQEDKMDTTKREQMLAKGFDIDGAMRRFINNEPLYIKCLKKFLDDTSYESLKKAYADKNCEDCFKYAHSMKGFTSNVGINEMYHLLTSMVEKLRTGDMNIEPELKQLEVLYQETYDIINDL